MKSLSLILGGLIVLLAGALVGVGSGFYFVKSNPAKFCPVLSSETPNVKYEISQEVMEKLVALEPGKTFNGKVSKKDGSGIVLDVWIFNPINPEGNQAVPVSIPFNSGVDKIFRPNILKTGATTTPASYNDVNVGDYLTVLIFEDHKEFGIISAK